MLRVGIQYISSFSSEGFSLDPITGAGIGNETGRVPNPFYDPEDPYSPASRTWSLGLR